MSCRNGGIVSIMGVYGRFPDKLPISHHLSLDEAPKGYDMFKHKQDNCTKVPLKP